MKVVRMSCHDTNKDVGGGYSIIEREYRDCVAWPEIVEQFNVFLASMDYIPREYNRFVMEIDNDD